MKKITLILGLILLVPLHTVLAQVESLYPSGYNIDCRHTLSASELSLGDTLTITRVLVNDESFSLTGLYFSTSLPPELDVISQILEVDGTPVSVTSVAPADNLIFTGYRHHTWIVDSPDTSEHISYTVAAGDSVCLTLRVIPSNIGEFLLPFYVTSFYGNNQTFFATTNIVDTVTVLLLSDVDDDQDNLPPDDYGLTVRAYPNPFNGSTNIAYQGTGLANTELRLEIYNTLGQLVHNTQVFSPVNQGVIWWNADEKLGSGIYFYRLANDHVQQTGKMLLLK